MSTVADIPINKHLGISYDEQTNRLSLPDTDQAKNHFGQVSFCAQFTLAEAASAQFMFEQLGMNLEQDIPTLRTANTKFYKPINGHSICNLISLEHSKEQFQNLLDQKGKISTSVQVEVVSSEGTRSLVGNFQWLVLRTQERP